MQSNRLLDFGIGFYTTSNEEQASRWAEKVSSRKNTGKQFLSIYSFDIEKAKKELSIIEFVKADEKWLNFCLFEEYKDLEEKYNFLKLKKLIKVNRSNKHKDCR